MRQRLLSLIKSYPSQFWLLFTGMMISTIGASMIWPFQMIYVSETLQKPLATAASLITLNSIAGLFSSFLSGPLIDRLGRKWLMTASLFFNGLGFLLLSQARTLPAFAIIMVMNGAVNPVYRIAADSMMADLIPPHRRSDAYALLRMSNNVGVAIGPAVGGFIASSSYTIAFICGATGMVIYSLLTLLFARETLPQRTPVTDSAIPEKEAFGGYLKIFQDRPFIKFVITFTLVQVCSTLIWVLMAVYAKGNYNLTEKLYGFIPMTNALMVIGLQIIVTGFSKKYNPLAVLTVGACFYTLGVGSVAFARDFWGFWTSMVIMTCGELLLMPTSSTYTANLAPADKRGRYMSLYGLTWGVASGIGPVLGGFFNDNLGPSFIWYGGAVVGFISVLGFLWMWSRSPSRQKRNDDLTSDIINGA